MSLREKLYKNISCGWELSSSKFFPRRSVGKGWMSVVMLWAKASLRDFVHGISTRFCVAKHPRLIHTQSGSTALESSTIVLPSYGYAPAPVSVRPRHCVGVDGCKIQSSYWALVSAQQRSGEALNMRTSISMTTTAWLSSLKGSVTTLNFTTINAHTVPWTDRHRCRCIPIWR